MILPEDYLVVNDIDRNYKPVSLLNSENNYKIQSNQYENQFQRLQQNNIDNIELKNNPRIYCPDQQLNNFMLNGNNIQNYKQNEEQYQKSPQNLQNFQQLGDLSMLSFDSKDENLQFQQNDDYLLQQNERTTFSKGNAYNYQQDQLFFFGGDDADFDNFNSNSNTKKDYDFFYQTNGFQKKSKKKRKENDTRKSSMQKRYQTIERIYKKETTQKIGNEWLSSGSSSKISIENMGSTYKNNNINNNNKIYMQGQKPLSAQLHHQNIKSLIQTNDIQKNLNNQQRQNNKKDEDIQNQGEYFQCSDILKQKMKPPQSANLLNHTKNIIQTKKNYKDIILQRPLTRQPEFSQQNSINSHRSTQLSYTPKTNQKLTNLDVNNQQQCMINNQFQSDGIYREGSQDSGFSFQNVYSLTNQRDKMMMISPNNSNQNIIESKGDGDFDQLFLDHNVYVSSSISQSQQNSNPQNLRNSKDDKKSFSNIGNSTKSTSRPIFKDINVKKDLFKNIQQIQKTTKKDDTNIDNTNKIVQKNKKRTIFKINNPQSQTLGLPLTSQQTQDEFDLISQNEQIDNDGEMQLNMNEQPQLQFQQEQQIQEQNAVTIDISQQLENPQTKQNISTDTYYGKKFIQQKQKSDQLTAQTIPSFSSSNSRITSLQATVAANRNISSASKYGSRQKNSISNQDYQQQQITQQQNANQNNLQNFNDQSDKKKQKKVKSNQVQQQSNTIQIAPVQKIFSMNSQDDYIRRTLIKMGWKENKIPQTSLFDLKWIYIDSNDDYKLLNDNQYYNHFKNNTEITQKGRLLYNLKNNTQFGVNSESFFPRCYDLGNDPERQEFSIEYYKHIQYIKLRRKEIYQVIKQEYSIKQNNKLNAQVNEGIVFRKGNKPKFISPLLFEDQKRDLKFLVNTSILADVVEMLRKIKKQQEDYLDETRISKEYQANLNPTSSFKLNSMIQQYVKINVPYDEDKFLYDKIIGMTKEFWQTPSLKLMTKLYSLYKFFKDADPQFKVSGTQNIWIIKPSANSRGSGIYLVDRLDEAIDSGLKMQARIVQKYIEKPLIFYGEKYKKLNNKKFDIRQWVLVTSFKPLKIFYFSSSYLRICSSSFDLNNLKNLSKHLTNFSLNKNNINKDNWDETVIDLKEFIGYLKEYKNIDYTEEVKPQIKGLIIETIKCAQDKIQPRKNSFELYGFDILLDEYARPWLLEVNLSPACSERTTFLTEMLEAMAQKMFQIVLNQPNDLNNLDIADVIDKEEQNKNNIDLKEDVQIQQKQNIDFEWEEIYNEALSEDYQDQGNQNSLAINQDLQLLVIGTKVDIKKERNLDKKYFQYWGAIKLQSKIRQFLARKQLINLRRIKNAIIIQKNCKVYLAKKQLKFLREQKASIQIQSMWRMKMNMNKLLSLKKNIIITKLQVLYKIKKAQQLLNHLRLTRFSTMIQTKYRQFKAKKLFKQMKYYKKCVVKIQSFYKRRYKQKCYSSTKIKAYAKMKTAQKQYQLMKKQHYAAIKIQSNYKRHKAQVQKQKLRLCEIVKKIYFHQKKILLNQLVQKVRIYPFTKLFVSIFHQKLKLVCLKKIFNMGIMRIRAAVRIQGLMKIKRAKRQKKRMYRLRLLIKLQRRVKAYLQRLKFLRILDKRKLSGIKVMYFLKQCVAKGKLLQLRYQYRKQLAIQEYEEQQYWLQMNDYQGQRPESQMKQRKQIQRPPSHLEQRNLSSSSSNRRENQSGQIDMYKTKQGFNYLKETQSRSNQIAQISNQKQQQQQQQLQSQNSNNNFLRHNSQNMFINQKTKQMNDQYNINQMIKNYTQQDESPNYNTKVVSSKSTQQINSQPFQSKQLLQTKQKSIPNSRQIINQDNMLNPNKTTNNFYDKSTQKFKLNSEIIKELDKNITKIQNNQRQTNNNNNNNNNNNQMSYTHSNFQRF